MRILAEEFTKDIIIEDEIVTIKKRSAADDMELEKAKKSGEDYEVGIAYLIAGLVKWTFKDAAGNILPITKEIILKIRSDVLNILIKEVIAFNTITKEEAKN